MKANRKKRTCCSKQINLMGPPWPIVIRSHLAILVVCLVFLFLKELVQTGLRIIQSPVPMQASVQIDLFRFKGLVDKNRKQSSLLWILMLKNITQQKVRTYRFGILFFFSWVILLQICSSLPLGIVEAGVTQTCDPRDGRRTLRI